MQYVDFPGTKEKVSVIGLGTWVFGGENWGGANDDDSLAAVREALDLGMNFIDTAPFYGDGKSERLIGQAIKGRREKAFIATKCGIVRENGRIRHDLTPASINREVDLSLKRLDCDAIDLYMCHWPDPNTPIEKTMEALVRLRNNGKIRYIGVSNFGFELLKKAHALAPVATLEVQYSILERGIEKDLLPFCLEKSIGVIAYGALGGGILTGKYSKTPQLGKWDARKMFYGFFEGEKFKSSQKLIERLNGMGKPLNQLALNWVRQQPGVMTVLAGCRDLQQVRGNVAAAEWDLSPDQFIKLTN